MMVSVQEPGKGVCCAGVSPNTGVEVPSGPAGMVKLFSEVPPVPLPQISVWPVRPPDKISRIAQSSANRTGW